MQALSAALESGLSVSAAESAVRGESVELPSLGLSRVSRALKGAPSQQEYAAGLQTRAD